jgi:hypothetical protein
MVLEADPDKPHVGGINSRLFTSGEPIRHKLSALFVPDRDLDPGLDPLIFVSDLQDAN